MSYWQEEHCSCGSVCDTAGDMAKACAVSNLVGSASGLPFDVNP
jgi:hypothetical protein